MQKYKVVYYENSYAEIDIEADSPDDAEERFWELWGTDETFVDEVFSSREVVDCSVNVDPWA